MTRINTNVSSLIAQKTLSRSNLDLQTSLTRLSTGLRINTGKDDPAGLIASENLRRDITSIGKAVSNSERANQLIATADSALGQVSSLLNDVRGLVVEAANTGALSEEQLAANQLQVDSSLEAIDRIAQVTTFQGRALLDGSLGFLYNVTSGGDSVVDLQVDQANLGATGQIGVDVDISAGATRAEVTNAGSPDAAATTTLNFAAGVDTTAVASGATFRSEAAALNDGTNDFDGVDVVIADGGAIGQGNETAVYDSGAGTLTITIDSANTDAVDVVNAINAEGTFTATQSTGVGTDAVVAADAGTIGTTDLDSIDITADTAGPDFNNVSVELQSGGATGATYDANTRTITVTVAPAGDTLANVTSAIDGLADFSATANANGDGTVNNGVDLTGTADTGLSGGGLQDDLVVKIAGLSGAEVFTFQAGATIDQVAAAVNLVSDAIGVTASNSSGALSLTSSEYGSDAFVDVEVISEGANGTFESNLSTTRANGTDVVATVNGFSANGDGNTLSINSTTLDFSLTVADGSTTPINFVITGGGALFQLGPDVVSNQQARIGIGSVNTAKLGGVSGRLYELRSGQTNDLQTNPDDAAKIVDQAIDKVTSLRGRLGAFQKTTIETNIYTLNDTLANLTEAESSIRDADFAAESARLTRAQILVQSGTSVLQIANSNPQNVLALLR